MGRQFVSADKSGVYMSVVLRPCFAAEKSGLITTAAAVSVAETVEKYTKKRVSIKWVNDVYLDGKKVCGILTEGRVSNGKFDHAILGIGLNVTEPRGGFDESIKDIAGALFPACTDFDAKEIAADILGNFWRYYENLVVKPHFSAYAERNMLVGKAVDIIRAGERCGEGRVLGLTEDFALRILTSAGEEILSSGEVSVKVK